MKRIVRRIVLRRLGSALLPALLLFSCGGDRDEVSPAPETPVRGGTFVTALSGDPGHLNPAISTMGVTHEASELMFNGLVGMDQNLNPIPELASSWTIEEDGALYRFTLKDGVTWHDGVAFTSRDVKFTFEELLLKFHGRTRASIRPNLAGIDTPDERTVVFRFREPYAPLLSQLDVTEAPILPSHVYAGSDPERNPANLRPIGTGPFKFGSFNQNSDLTLVRNPAYFKPGLPYLDTVKMRIIPDAAARILALQKGEVDWIHEREGFGADTASLERTPNSGRPEKPLDPGGRKLRHDNQLQPRSAGLRGPEGPPGDLPRGRSASLLRRHPLRPGCCRRLAHLGRYPLGPRSEPARPRIRPP